MIIRETLEAAEEQTLHPRAARSASARRARREAPCSIRTAFQRDRDRILHTKAFRRLKHKTQVFLSPEGDHYRTRMTHTLEVAQIARTVARALRLNEDLAEAIALAHDLGHPPFGHVGEKVLNRLVKTYSPDAADMRKGFRHDVQSLRVVERLENEGRGLNLTLEVKNGIVKHSKGKSGKILRERAMTLEAEVVRAADIIAYVNHDTDDAIRAGFLRPGDIPKKYRKLLGDTVSARLRNVVTDVVRESLATDLASIRMRDEMLEAVTGMRAFLFERVYEHPRLTRGFEKTEHVLEALYEHALKNPKEYTAPYPRGDSAARRALDFVAGMSDRYALNLYEELFVPRGWKL
jgi:dGTPase